MVLFSDIVQQKAEKDQCADNNGQKDDQSKNNIVVNLGIESH